METLRDLDVVRALMPRATELRAAGGDGEAEAEAPSMPTLVSRFSPFDTWYEIDSIFEGRFLERTTKGAFRKTIKENRGNVKVLFDHGYDTQIGNKVLGAVDDLREDDDSAVGEVPLFDTSYNRDLLPGLEAGVYGSSFRFRVIRDEWNDDPGRSDSNPDGIPERTIKEVRLFEFGPVTFPANPDATAGVRCLTDIYYERVRSRDPRRVEDLLSRARALRTPDAGAAHLGTPADGAALLADAPPSGTRGLSPEKRAAQLRGLELLELT
jgi:HK97 family phage prohead protease